MSDTRQVIDNQLPVNISVLCDLLDYLCGAFILTPILTPSSLVLDSITLPRSWFLSLLQHLQERLIKREVPATYFVALLKDLLERLLTGLNCGTSQIDKDSNLPLIIH